MIIQYLIVTLLGFIAQDLLEPGTPRVILWLIIGACLWGDVIVRIVGWYAGVRRVEDGMGVKRDR